MPHLIGDELVLRGLEYEANARRLLPLVQSVIYVGENLRRRHFVYVAHGHQRVSLGPLGRPQEHRRRSHRQHSRQNTSGPAFSHP